MRDHRYRVWNPATETMTYNVGLDRISEYADETLVKMQMTGLKDRRGNNIYEGDILRFPPKDWREERDFIGYEVFYHDNDCADNHIGFQMNRMRFYGNLCGGECRAKMLPKYTLQMEIISHIYETPELLKQE